jgi:hypothetical protein
LSNHFCQGQDISVGGSQGRSKVFYLPAELLHGGDAERGKSFIVDRSKIAYFFPIDEDMAVLYLFSVDDNL